MERVEKHWKTAQRSCKEITAGDIKKCLAIALEYMVYGDRGGSVKIRVGLNDLNGLS